MNILIATPAPRGSQSGNRVTAERWARMMRQMGHRVEIVCELPGDSRLAIEGRHMRSPDLLISLHATKTYRSVDWFAKSFPECPIAVCLTGTDLYADLGERSQPVRRKRAMRSLEAADLILSLRSLAEGDLPAEFESKIRVIEQSASPTKNPPSPLVTRWEVTIAGHLRKIKDPISDCRCRETTASRVSR